MASESRTAWVVKSSSIEKPWGEETSWQSPNSVRVKTFNLSKGKRNSFKYNRLKDELLICASGKLRAYFADESFVTKGIGDITSQELYPGMALSVQASCPYRLEALEDSTILEISTTSRTDNVVRLHDDYGRETEFISKYVTGVVKKWFPT